jgi:hypothetical protein
MKFGDKLRQYLVNLCQFFGLGTIYVPSKAITEYIFTGNTSADVTRWSILSLTTGIVILILGAIIAEEGDRKDG